MFNITLIITIAVITALAYFKGRGVLYSMIVAFYPSVILYQSLPWIKNLIFMKDNANQIYYSHAIVFLIIFALIFWVTKRLMHGEGMRGGVAGFTDALLLALSIVLLTIALTFHILPARDIYDLSANIQRFLNSGTGYFVSVLVPLVVVFWLSKRY